MKSTLTAPALTAAITCVLAALNIAPAHADGMQPETTIVVIQEADGEATLNVKNTDGAPALLHTVVHDIAEDAETIVVASPTVARVEPGREQLVRFIYQGEPLTVQRMKRVTFDTIGQSRKSDGTSSVGVSVRQNLPIILNPKGLPRHEKPWELLSWSLKGDQLTVSNDSPYIVRLAQEVSLVPSGGTAELPRGYVLPGERLVAVATDAGTAHAVRIEPATVYGFTVKSFEAPLK